MHRQGGTGQQKNEHHYPKPLLGSAHLPLHHEHDVFPDTVPLLNALSPVAPSQASLAL